jgi:hypothetical protein
MGATATGVALWGNALPTLAVRDAHGWHLDPFFDAGESFYTLAADWRLRLHVPAGVQSVETGARIAAQTRPDGSSDVVALAHGVRDPLVVAGPAAQLRPAERVAADGTRVRVWSASPDAPTQQDVLRDAVGAYDHYTRTYGSANLPELDVVDIDGVSGMEYSGAVLARSKHEVAHEIAHQWFYGAVGNDQFHDPWLDEAFAEFATRDYFEHGPGHRSDTRLLSIGERLLATVVAPLGRLLGHPTDPVQPGANQQLYRVSVYMGGARVLEQLRSEIGQAAFAAGMRSYVDRFRNDVATTRDFVRAMSAAAGRDLTTWFAAQGVQVA